MTTAPFRPPRWARGGHRQTLLGVFVRRRLRWDGPCEDRIVEAGDGVRLLVRASWQPGPRAERPGVVLVHGLAGSDRATHVIATAREAWSRGWHVLRMNMRGAGDSVALCARLYNAGLDGDLLAVLRALAPEVPQLGVAGFSLGGSLALLLAGRRASELPAAVRAFAAVSPPLDLAVCADTFAQPANRLYAANFLRELRAAYRARQRRLPELYAPGREGGLRTIRAYDTAITAVYGGFRDCDHYYADSSAGPHLSRVDRPTLVLAAADDPLIPQASVERWPLPASGCVRREILATGGHVGFVAPTRAPGRFWAAERVMDFLDEAVGATPTLPIRGSSRAG